LAASLRKNGRIGAIEIARAVGMPLRIAAKVDPVARDYYVHTIKPLLRDRDIE
jgi:hypothetical protein